MILSREDSGENKAVDDFRYPFVADVVGNTICADLIDYLRRDHLFTGLPLAIGDRFLTGAYVSASAEVHFKERVVIPISRNGHERTDAVSEILKYLRYRYELSERALVRQRQLAGPR